MSPQGIVATSGDRLSCPSSGEEATGIGWADSGVAAQCPTMPGVQQPKALTMYLHRHRSHAILEDARPALSAMTSSRGPLDRPEGLAAEIQGGRKDMPSPQ